MRIARLWALISLREKLLMLNLIVVAALLLQSLQARHALTAQSQAQSRQVTIAEAFHLSKQADMMHDALKSDVLASLLVGQIPGVNHEDAIRQLSGDIRSFDGAFSALAAITLSSALNDRIQHNRVLADDYAKAAMALVKSAAHDRSAAMAALPDFESRFQQLYKALDEQGVALGTELKSAQEVARQEAEMAAVSLLWTGGLTVVIASLFVVLVTSAIRNRLSELANVAEVIASGGLDDGSRSKRTSKLRDLEVTIDELASNLGHLIQTMRNDAKRALFGKQLGEALDMADREQQVAKVTARAMSEISPSHPMELLLADSSHAQLERASEHPLAGSPGCNITSPFDCVAVRRGTMVAFESSEMLNACDQLRGRPCGAISAVCTPVTFMGRTIGVLHAAGSVEAPLMPEQASQLASLAAKIGRRIATVRAFEKTQLQAVTDGLTGLPNRRTLEERVRTLASSNELFSIVMCDLDHFKRLNDTHGHAAGDNALRLFAEALRHSMRESDHAGRWGGEEFVFVLANVDAIKATEMVDRLRARLAASLQMGKSPRFTASFGISDSDMSRIPEQLIEFADAALYQAKVAGRDRAVVANSNAAEPSGATLRLAEPSPHGIDMHQAASAA